MEGRPAHHLRAALTVMLLQLVAIDLLTAGEMSVLYLSDRSTVCVSAISPSLSLVAPGSDRNTRGGDGLSDETAD